jgi:ribonuclease-3
MKELEEKLEYKFNNRELLRTALTHSSYANENRHSGAVCNERLEFLGDSVLGMTVADYLYRNYPDLSEGRMTKMRAELVCEQSLVNVAEKLGLGEYLRLGKGEELGGGRHRKSIIADAVEAVIASVYLDGGQERAAKIIYKFILDPISGETVQNHDYKTVLQEKVQRMEGKVLSYQLTGESGPDHMKTFTVEVVLSGEVLASGTGRTKKAAEQAAAKNALEGMK